MTVIESAVVSGLTTSVKSDTNGPRRVRHVLDSNTSLMRKLSLAVHLSALGYSFMASGDSQ